MIATRLCFSSIDDCLGPGHERYFAQGYRRVQHHVSAVELRLDPSAPMATANATARLSFPDDWSVKGADRARTPHLTSIDCVVLSVRLIEALLGGALGLGPGRLRRAQLRKITVRAGTKPIEEVDDVPLTGELLIPGGGRESLLEADVECRIGTMRVSAVVELPVGAAPTPPQADTDEAACAAYYFREIYKAQDRSIDNVVLETASGSAAATVTVRGPSATDGFSSACLPGFTLIDGMLVLAQLSQALLYELDGMTRASSDNLWMRRLMIESAVAAPSDLTKLDGLRVGTSLTKTTIVQVNGERWRTSDWAAEILGTRYTYGLAHKTDPPLAEHTSRHSRGE